MTSLRKFANAKVLVIGDVMLDRYWWGTVNRISPEAPVPVVHLDKSTTAPGGAANVALNVVGLGAQPILIGCVGDDADGETLSRELISRGVDASSLIQLSGRPTSVKTRVIAHNQQVVRVDSETCSPLSAGDESEAWKVVMAFLPQADIIVVSDYAKGFLTIGLLRNLIVECSRAGKMVFVDPKGKDYSKYRGATLLTPNRREAAEACNFEESMPDLVVNSGQRLIDELSLERLLITEGENGMTLFQKDAIPLHIETAAKEIYDVTGAGDTVVATLAVAVSSGYDFLEAARLANLAAGVVVEQVGTTAIAIDQLGEVLQGTEADSFAV